MNQDEIMEFAQQADAYADAMDIGGKNYIGLRDEYFAKLVAAKEREACAKVCGRLADEALVVGDEDAVICFEEAEELIRERGEA
jgi:hypothetical protein